MGIITVYMLLVHMNGAREQLGNFSLDADLEEKHGNKYKL